MKQSIDQLIDQVDDLIVDARRHIQVVVRKWFTALERETREQQKREYLLLLVQSCCNAANLTGSLPKPFDKSPPDGPLPRLPMHLILKTTRKRVSGDGSVSRRSQPILFHHEPSSSTHGGGSSNSTRGGGGSKSVRGGGGSNSTVRGGGASTQTRSSTNDRHPNRSRSAAPSTTPTRHAQVHKNNRATGTAATDIIPSPPDTSAATAAAAAAAAKHVVSNIFQTYSNRSAKIGSMSRLELENKVLELHSIVETQRERIEYFQSELRIQQGMRKRGEERQVELHKLELKHANKDRERQLHLAAMEAVRHPAEQLLEERMQMVAHAEKEELLRKKFVQEELAGRTEGSDAGANSKNDTKSSTCMLSDERQSDQDFLEYLDRFTLRTEQLAGNLL